MALTSTVWTATGTISRSPISRLAHIHLGAVGRAGLVVGQGDRTAGGDAQIGLIQVHDLAAGQTAVDRQRGPEDDVNNDPPAAPEDDVNNEPPADVENDVNNEPR